MTAGQTTSATAAPATAKRSSFAHKLYTGEFAWDFVGRRKLWYAISGVLVLIALGALLLRGGLNLGIEFKGGADFQAPTQVTGQTVSGMRQAIEDLKLEKMDDLTVKTIGNDRVQVQTRALSATAANDEVAKVRAAIAKQVNAPSEKVAYSLIGASWGKQITQQGLVALVVFLVLVMLLMALYFREWKMSVAAILALAHDLILTLGLYALIGFTFTPASLIGVLTILGYSLYDTVVVFDKVRENTRDMERQNRSYSSAANLALNQVLIRSINTTIIGVLPVAALLIAGAAVLGTGPLKDLGLALFIGMLVGAYSSVFIAVPALCHMKEAEPAMKEHRRRLERREVRHTVAPPKPGTKAAKVATASSIEPDGIAVDGELTSPGARQVVSRPAPPPKTRRPLSDSGARSQPQRSPREQRRKG